MNVLQSAHRFQSTRPARGATIAAVVSCPELAFQSTRPARGATSHAAFRLTSIQVSIHAPRAGRDEVAALDDSWRLQFQSTRPARGATSVSSAREPALASCFNPRAPRGARPPQLTSPPISSSGFNPRAPRGARRTGSASNDAGHRRFNPRAPRGARRPPSLLPRCRSSFNPRAPRGARPTCRCSVASDCDVSIHAPRAGRDDADSATGRTVGRFQSTRPARGATSTRTLRIAAQECFNPRAPRGARPISGARLRERRQVSIHAPRAGRDDTACEIAGAEATFQSTRPARGATRLAASAFSAAQRVSIHAPRAGRDGIELSTRVTATGAFQSTRPARGATRCQRRRSHAVMVSIHAPRAGRDARSDAHDCAKSMFQSTRPARGATPRSVSQHGEHVVSFNPRAPRGARPGFEASVADRLQCFNPRAPRGARQRPRHTSTPRVFQSTRPARGATRGTLPSTLARAVSIHAPRAGRDSRHGAARSSQAMFQSTRPARGATGNCASSCMQSTGFNPRAPRGARRSTCR